MADMFASADGYERFMGRWSARLAPRFAEFAGVGGRVLDVGCGTGAMIRVLGERAGPTWLFGVDPSRPFLARAREEFHGGRRAFQRGSATALPYRDAAFDGCVSLLLLQLLARPHDAVAEMVRVTVPGGVVAACAWDGRALAMVRILREEAQRLGFGPPPGAGRIPTCCDREQLLEVWRGAGLAEVDSLAIELTTEFSSFDDYWSPLLAGVGPGGALVAGLTPEQRARLREALRSRLLGDGPDGPFRLGARAWAVRGVVSARG